MTVLSLAESPSSTVVLSAKRPNAFFSAVIVPLIIFVLVVVTVSLPFAYNDIDSSPEAEMEPSVISKIPSLLYTPVTFIPFISIFPVFFPDEFLSLITIPIVSTEPESPFFIRLLFTISAPF